MPKSPTRKKSNNSNNTRKSPRNLFANDPLMAAMNRGNVTWGDLMRSAPAANGAPNAHRYSVNSVNEPLENWSMPNIRTRKGIWENFPVVLKEIDEGDGIERYAVEWHKKNLDEWRESRSASFAEWAEYKAFAEYRLLHSLTAHHYIMEPPRNRDMIVVLNFGPKPPAAAAGPSFNGPKLVKRADINKVFPMLIIDSRPGVAGEATFAIIMRGDYQRKTDKSIVVAKTAEIMRALNASKHWIVLPPREKDELCRIQMAHA